MTRLPAVNDPADYAQWGTLLNDYLLHDHTDDGRHRTHFDVASYGAFGVGNDTAAVQAAINAAAVKNGDVFFSPIPYNVSGLTLPSGVRLRGMVANPSDITKGSVLVGTPGQDIISMAAGTTWCGIENLQFYGGANHVVMHDNVTQLTVEDCGFSNASNAAFYVPTGSIEEIYMRRVSAAGVGYFWKHDNVTFNGSNYMDKCRFENIQIYSASQNAWNINVNFANTVTWQSMKMGGSQGHTFVFAGGGRGLVFIDMNCESNGLAGKKARTTGTVSAGSTALTVASGAGLANGDPLVVQGAGASGADHYTTIANITGIAVTMANAAVTAVTSLAVTNASYDEFLFNGNGNNPAYTTFIGGSFGAENNGSKRYAINNAAQSGLVVIGTMTNGFPIYDPGRAAQTLGGNAFLRQPQNVLNDAMRYTTFAPAGQPEQWRTLISSPAGGHLHFALADSIGNRQGTYNDLSIYKADLNATRIALFRGVDATFIPRRLAWTNMTFGVGATVIDVTGVNVAKTAVNVSPVTITGLTSSAGVWQPLTIIFVDGNTIIQNNATIKLLGAVNFVGSADDTLVLQYDGSVWRELSRSLN